MQIQMPDMPHRILNAILIVASVQMLAIAGGGWMLYQFAMARMDTNVERLTERIDANGERIDRNSVLIGQIGERVDRNADLIARNAELIRQNAERIDRNGELITQLRERMTAVEVRVGALEEVVRFFHPPESGLRQNP